MCNPLVSIQINCHNGEKYLSEAIDSIYKQTYKNWEIIFWDNASSDASAKIAKSYDGKLRYFFTSSNHLSPSNFVSKYCLDLYGKVRGLKA